MNKRNIFFAALIILLIVIGYYGYRVFTVHHEKLGEISFYKDTNIELKVVLVHENLPFHYVGNTYSIACQSQNTKTFPERKWDKIEQGWNRVPDAYLGNGLGTDENALLQSLATEAKKMYLVKDSETLVVLASPNVYISFDGCRTFTNWNLKDNLSASLIIESTPEFEKCEEQQKKDQEMGLTSYGDCSYFKLSGKNQLVFQDVVADNQGHATFKVTSFAFKDNKTVNVETKDFGKTWQNIISN